VTGNIIQEARTPVLMAGTMRRERISALTGDITLSVHSSALTVDTMPADRFLVLMVGITCRPHFSASTASITSRVHSSGFTGSMSTLNRGLPKNTETMADY